MSMRKRTTIRPSSVSSRMMSARGMEDFFGLVFFGEHMFYIIRVWAVGVNGGLTWRGMKCGRRGAVRAATANRGLRFLGFARNDRGGARWWSDRRELSWRRQLGADGSRGLRTWCWRVPRGGSSLRSRMTEGDGGGLLTGIFSEIGGKCGAVEMGIRRFRAVITPRAISSQLHYGFGVSGGEGVHVGEDKLFGAVAAELLDVLLSDYRERIEYVARIASRQAVQAEVQRVEAGRRKCCRSSASHTNGNPV